jgi:1-deoxy-D-xylulose-5-phosphate reductoisomerase
VQNIVILGSTGSIGKNALDIVDRNTDKLRVLGLAANRNHILLSKQITKYNPPYVAINDKAGLAVLRNTFIDSPINILDNSGIRSALEILSSLPDADIILNAVVGAAGLKPTVAALKAGKRVALANKESMVAAGPILRQLADEYNGQIIPVDSEHSAIFQCLQAGKKDEVASLILTGSGGPFLNRDNLENITVKEALHHPTWSMGPKITVDSATMMNKGLEVIEAVYLFDLPPEKIRVVIHPQSIVHSMVEFIDGSIVAQMSIPDMRLPIQYALLYPERVPLDVCQIDFSKRFSLDFRPPDMEKFRALKLAYRAVKEGGISPAVLNAANEVAVKAFLEEKIKFLQIYNVIEKTMDDIGTGRAVTLEDVLSADLRSSEVANNIVNSL